MIRGCSLVNACQVDLFSDWTQIGLKIKKSLCVSKSVALVAFIIYKKKKKRKLKGFQFE
jgi:hypothetical protein